MLFLSVWTARAGEGEGKGGAYAAGRWSWHKSEAVVDYVSMMKRDQEEGNEDEGADGGEEREGEKEGRKSR